MDVAVRDVLPALWSEGMTINIPFLIGYVFAALTYVIGIAHRFGIIGDTIEWRFAVRALLAGCFYTFFLGCLDILGA